MYLNSKYAHGKFYKMFYQKLLHKFNNCTINLSKSIMVPGNIQFQKIKKQNNSISKERSKIMIDQLSEFLKNTNQENFIDVIPKRLLQNYSSKNSLLYLVDPSTAKDLIYIISQELLQEPCFVVECNPGLGLLTQELLNIGVPHIALFEKCANFNNPCSPLGTIIKKHESRLSLKDISFHHFCLHLMKNKYLGKDDLNKFIISYTDYKRIAYIIPIINKASISLIMYNFCNQTILFKGKLTFYLIISSSIWKVCITYLFKKRDN
jgi:hypothetical protein